MPRSYMKIRRAEREDVAAMLSVAAALTDWFGTYVINKVMPIDFVLQRGFVAEDANGIVGFLTYISDHAKVLITWFGIRLDQHRNGIGSKLLTAIEHELRSVGVTEVRLNTVIASGDTGPYHNTHAFYKKMGFTAEKEFELPRADGVEPLDMVTYVKFI